MEKLFIPKKLQVGFDKRGDTYTGDLAFIIYEKEDGTLFNGTRWEKWRDKKINSVKYDNVPMSGFILNRNGGGGRGWDARNPFIRIWDPRGFEFEISIENLLFIFQYCSLIKGKGLEGEFIYAWDKMNLALLPVDCDEYKQCLNFTDIRNAKQLTNDDLVPGFTYIDNDLNQIVYLGKLKHLEYNYSNLSLKYENVFYNLGNKNHYYCNIEGNYVKNDNYIGIIHVDIKNIKKVFDASVYFDYANIIKKLQEQGTVLFNKIQLEFSSQKFDSKENYYGGLSKNIYWLKNDKGTFELMFVSKYVEVSSSRYDVASVKKETFQLSKIGELTIKDDDVIIKKLSSKSKRNKEYTEAEIRDMLWLRLNAVIGGKTTKEIFL